MCYFIYLRLIPQRKPDEAEALAAAQQVVGRHGLYLYTHRSGLTVANNGHCACDLILKSKRIEGSVIGFVRELVGMSVIKSVEIGYRWSEPMPKDAPIRRLSIEEIISLSETSGLSEGIWYRVNDPSKYDFGNLGHPAPAV